MTTFEQAIDYIKATKSEQGKKVIPNTRQQLSFGVEMKTLTISGAATGGSAERQKAVTFWCMHGFKFSFDIVKPYVFIYKKGRNIFFLRPTEVVENVN